MVETPTCAELPRMLMLQKRLQSRPGCVHWSQLKNPPRHSKHFAFFTVNIHVHIKEKHTHIYAPGPATPPLPPTPMGWVPYTGPIWDLPPPTPCGVVGVWHCPPPPPVVWWGCGMVCWVCMVCMVGLVWHVWKVWYVWYVWYVWHEWLVLYGW